MKKLILKSLFALQIFVFAICSIFAQVSVNPNDKFYREAQGWELRNLTTKALPLIRPYPVNVVREILDDVIENKSGSANEKDIQIALDEYERFFGTTEKEKKITVFAQGTGDIKLSQIETEDKNGETVKEKKNIKNLTAELGVQGDLKLHDIVGFGYKLQFYAEKKNFYEFAPIYTNKMNDAIYDSSDIGPFSNYNDWNANAQVGNTTVYAAAGVSRVGYGAFLGDGLALNDSSYHSANLVFNVTREKWSYASVFASIGAKMNNPTDYDDLTNGKYLAFHSIKYRVTPKFDVSYYENVLFGPSTNLAYLFPAPYMAIQNIGGANDNVQMGFLFEVKPISGLSWATDIFVDDIEVNDVVKGNFDTKLRFGVQSGLTYFPEKSAVSFLSANYQVVLPYVYSHWEYENHNSGFIDGNTINYQNYTNSGINIGSSLDPNSDKISFSTKINPTKNLTIGFDTSFMRHANTAEAFNEEDSAKYILAKNKQYATDGSANMHQMFSDENDTHGEHVYQAWEKLGFMSSDHKMYVTQATLSAQYDFPKTKAGQMSLKLGYTFEYIKNANVNTNIYKGGTIQYKENTDGTYNWTDRTGNHTNESLDNFKSSVKNEAELQKQEWINNLRDEINHYFSVSVKYQY